MVSWDLELELAVPGEQPAHLPAAFLGTQIKPLANSAKLIWSYCHMLMLSALEKTAVSVSLSLLQELKKSGILVKCPKFSKFLHGMALLYPDRCEHTPRWFIWDELAGTASPATLDEMRELNPPKAAPAEEAIQVGCGHGHRASLIPNCNP